MAYGLTEKEIAMIKAVFEKTPEAESVFIYGSRAKNTYKKTSDIDLAVVLKSKSENILAKLKLDLDDLPIIYEIDLTDETEMRAGDFKDEYERTRKVFYLRGWREANLSEVINLVGGGTPKTSEFEYWNGNISWLSVVDFNNDQRVDISDFSVLAQTWLFSEGQTGYNEACDIVDDNTIDINDLIFMMEYWLNGG